MRTTLNIDDGAFVMMKKYADERKISLGQAASDLVHRGAENLPEFRTKNGWVVFDLPPGTSTVTSEKLAQWKKTDQDEEHRRAFSPRR